MARTQAADYGDKRASITHEAAKLFAEYGFAGASLSVLASKCDVSKSVLYHYFSSKEEMLYEIMSTHMDLLLETTQSEFYKNIPVQRRFVRLSELLLERYSGGQDAQKVLLNDLGYLPKKERSDIIQRQRKLIAFAEDCLMKAIGRRKPNKDVLRAQIMLFFGMINWSHSWFNPKKGLTRDRLAKQAAEATILPLLKS